MKGAGIRVYEYANRATIVACCLQLEALFWLCKDADSVAQTNGMAQEKAQLRKAGTLDECNKRGLLDFAKLKTARILNSAGATICPLCLDELSGQGFFDRMTQAEGRVVPDLTITKLNLFHIAELHIQALNHTPYNLGWGHHHCNVVVKDSGIRETLEWMREVLARNIDQGYLAAENSGS